MKFERPVINKSAIWLAIIFGAVMSAIRLYSLRTTADGHEWHYLSLAIIIATVLILLMEFKMPIIAETIFGLAFPTVMFILVENFSHPANEVYQGAWFLNLILYYAIFFVLFFVIGRLSISIIVMSALLGFAGLANYFVVLFRSSPILPWDIFSIGVAASVADNFEYNLSARACNVLLLIMLIWAVALKMRLKLPMKTVRLTGIVLAFVFLFGVILGVQVETVDSRFKLDTTLFTPKVFYRNNGMLLSFTRNFRYLRVDKPDGYSKETLEQLQEQLESDSENKVSVSKDRPNIIVVMNEAFSDLSVLGDYETNVEVMPFIKSLTENTQKGYMYASVKGGNTANTEFEFLTGMSMRFLPTGSVPYQQYIRSTLPTLASQLSSLGYITAAIHPYYSSGWNRNKVYDDFGFEEKYFIDTMSGAEKLRTYVSDWATYEKLIERYEEKDEKDRFFFFDVTMQNHGSYVRTYDNFVSDVTIKDGEGTYIKATEQYLSLIKRSDEAFKQLVDYFKNQEEPTIILMFGDHQPADYITKNVDTGKCYGDWGEESDDLNTRKERYMVPYVLWANYDIPESCDNETSANYLALSLLEAANLPLSSFQQYLREVQAKVPVLSANYVNNLSLEDENKVLYSYQLLQYNYLFDKKNKLVSLFEPME